MAVGPQMVRCHWRGACGFQLVPTAGSGPNKGIGGEGSCEAAVHVVDECCATHHQGRSDASEMAAGRRCRSEVVGGLHRSGACPGQGERLE